MKSFENNISHNTQEQETVLENLSVESEVALRSKEYLGTLSSEDFTALIDKDFQDTLIEIPPIDRVFDPEYELSQIRTLPKNEQRLALESFKDTLVRQRKAIAACRSFIERMIAFDNTVQKEQLVDITLRYASEYGFSELNLAYFEHMIDLYFECRNRVLEKRAEFLDDRELVQDLTGIELDIHADCRVEIGPVSFDIFVDGMSASALYHKQKDAVPNFRHGGFSTQKSNTDPVMYNVINMDPIVRRSSQDIEAVNTLTHEREHQKNRMLRSIFDSTEPSTFVKHLKEYRIVQDPVFKREILEVAFSNEMTNAYERAKDEIIAILSSKSIQYLRTQTHTLFFSGQIEAYDYLKKHRELGVLRNDALYNEVAKELLVTKYKKVLTRGIAAITNLVKVGGYTNAEATALLTDKTLPEWPQTVRRILAYD
jgi:hypothetical protein